MTENQNDEALKVGDIVKASFVGEIIRGVLTELTETSAAIQYFNKDGDRCILYTKYLEGIELVERSKQNLLLITTGNKIDYDIARYASQKLNTGVTVMRIDNWNSFIKQLETIDAYKNVIIIDENLEERLISGLN